MTEWIWLNGQILPMNEARIDPEDRGFQFADGIYEVIRVYSGQPFTLPQHLDRLVRSAEGIQIPLPLDRAALTSEIGKLLAKSGVREGMIYLQLTRGAAPRNHVFPDGCKPTLLFYARPLPPANEPGNGPGVKLHPVPDDRWKRCWIKSIALLPNVLAKNVAIAAGADEALFIEDGIVNECSASSLFAIVNNKLITAPAGPRVLPGITSLVLLELAPQLGIPVEQRHLKESELRTASELFISSTTREVAWVSHVAAHQVSTRPGPLTVKLHQAYAARVRRETTPA